jgi:hypothetical protein
MIDINVRNENLYEALLALTKLTIDIITRRIENVLEVTTETMWQQENGGTYSKRPIQEPLWAIILHRLEKEISTTEEYSNFKNVVESDETISPQLDTLVGSDFEASRLETRNIANWAIYEFLTGQGITQFNIRTYNEIYSKIESALYSDEIEYEVLTHLCGFRSAEPEISLDENISIIKLGKAEIIDVLNLGINLGTSMGSMDFIHNLHEYAIKTTFKSKKVIGDNAKDINTIQGNPYANGTYATAIIDALRIYKEGKLYPITTIRRSNSLLSNGISFSFETPVKNFMLDKYILLETESSSFKSFWEKHKQNKPADKGFLSVAIRRFSQSNERDNIEDRIIDLMISAESIFLSSGGSFAGELKYRLSHRAAMYIEDNVDKQRYVFEFMQKAYDVRSSIVHGSKPKLPKKIDNSEYTLEEFCNDIENYLRLSIKKAINENSYKEAKTNTIDWNSVIFPEQNK